jgi:hypothetical protein
MERWRDGFPVPEEQTIFVANVFKQMEGDERWVGVLHWYSWAGSVPSVSLLFKRITVNQAAQLSSQEYGSLPVGLLPTVV